MELTEKGRLTFDIANKQDCYKYARWLSLADKTTILETIIKGTKITIQFDRSTVINTDETPDFSKEQEIVDETEEDCTCSLHGEGCNICANKE